MRVMLCSPVTPGVTPGPVTLVLRVATTPKSRSEGRHIIIISIPFERLYAQSSHFICGNGS